VCGQTGRNTHLSNHILRGRIVRKRRDLLDVLAEGRRYACSPCTDNLAVGDLVDVQADGGGTARILERRPRQNRFSRRAAGKRPVEQVLAANLDRLVAVIAAAQPKPRWRMLDRYLIQAESAGIPALVCITKADLGVPAEVETYRRIGYPIAITSAETGEGLGPLRDQLTGATSALVGPSGVGKTTLIGRLTGTEGRATGAVSSSSGKGRHTTCDAEMVELPDGGGIIDTPGARQFALWEIDRTDVAGCFPEIRRHRDTCRFGEDCLHAHEPDCAVKAAVRSGEIAPARYLSYLRLIGEDTPDLEPAPCFTCMQCGFTIPVSAPGTAHRNHCPACLWSRHVDARAGDRAAACGSPMEPIAVSVRPDGEWSLVHRCRDCGAIKANRIAGDDNPSLLMSLAARPLARPPFPLDRLVAGPRTS